MPVDDSTDLSGWTPGGSAPTDFERDRWGPLRDFVRDHVPPAVRGARFDPGQRGLLLIAALALVAAVTALIVAWRSAARPAVNAPIAAPRVAVPPLATPSAAASPSSAAQDVVVDVAGKVRKPGLVKLGAGARVADAIAAAGGLLPGSSTQGLSLARRVLDGEQLLVGLPQQPAPIGSTSAPAASDSASAAEPLNLNTATVSELDALPGIGPVLAQRILDWRASHGTFTSVDQLREISGLGGKKFDAIAALVRV